MKIESKLLYLSWIAAICVLIGFSRGRQNETTAFQGIADTREVIINSKKAVEVRAIHAVPGQTVAKGSLLVELERPELTMKINEIINQLKELKSRRAITRDDLKSEISRLSGELKVRAAQIDFKIEQIESRHQFNRSMLSQLKSFSSDETSLHPPAGVPLELKNLRRERDLISRKFNSEIQDLKTKLASLETHDGILRQSREKELESLRAEKQSLMISASINAVIGSIHCKAGEKISPFDPILTIHPRSPSHVTGYINERVYTLAAVGDKVIVTALAAGETKSLEGEIVGVGSRIVDYPARLKKRPELPVWGREVKILLPKENAFLLGEKVLIETSGQGTVNSIADFLARLFSSRAPGPKSLSPDNPDPKKSAPEKAAGLQQILQKVFS